MSKKTYTTFAKEYNALLRHREFKYYTAKMIFDSMVAIAERVFAADNEKFDRDRFFNAVYGEVKGK